MNHGYGHLRIYIDHLFLKENCFDGFVSFVSFFNFVGMHFPVSRMLEVNSHSGNTKCQMETGHKNQHGSKKRTKSFKEERLLKRSI